MSLTPEARLVHDDVLHALALIRALEKELVQVFTRLATLLPQAPDA